MIRTLWSIDAKMNIHKIKATLNTAACKSLSDRSMPTQNSTVNEINHHHMVSAMHLNAPREAAEQELDGARLLL